VIELQERDSMNTNEYFETAAPGATAFLCDDDRACQYLNAFVDEDDFDEMCLECHGKRVNADLIEVTLGDDGIWRGSSRPAWYGRELRQYNWAVRILDGATVEIVTCEMADE